MFYEANMYTTRGSALRFRYRSSGIEAELYGDHIG